jgi:hypothetical protein
MFVHSVYFWLKPGLSEADRQAYLAGLRSLLTIPSVRWGYIGTPAATDRPVIDRSYSYALIAIFDNPAGHDLYQVHPVHDRFRDSCAGYWSRVQIYDALDS